MAALSDLGVLPLTAGAALTVLLALLPKKARRVGLLAALVVALALTLAQWQAVADGVKLLLNRFAAASELRQAYTYTRFTISAAEDQWDTCIQAALLVLGLTLGAVCATARRWKWMTAALFLVYAASVAYLGVSPAPRWSVALVAAVGLCLMEPGDLHWSRLAWVGGGLAMFAILCALIFSLAPGEDAALSAWEEGARDYLALETVAYGDAQQQTQTQPPVEEEDQFYREEDALADTDGEDQDWEAPVAPVLVIALFALLLFIPSVFSDLRKKRIARNRAGLHDPDDPTAIRASFLYALRWLRLGGLEIRNVPFGGYSGQVEALLSPAYRAEFEAVVPLWQEAAYSSHPMTKEQRETMARFLEDTQQQVWDHLGRRKRFLVKYFYAI
jgi:hypothetical protein